MTSVADRRAAAVRLAEALRALNSAAVLSEVPAGELAAVGGTVALLFDDALGTAASRRVWPSVTSRLVTRYLRPVPVGLPLLIRAAVAGADGRRMTVRGTLSTEADPDVPLATGEAVFVELGREQAIAMLGSDLRRVHGRPVPADTA